MVIGIVRNLLRVIDVLLSEDFKGECRFPYVIDHETCSYWRVLKLLSSVVESLPPFVSSITRRTLFSLVHLSDSRHSSQGRGASFALFICASFWIVHDNPPKWPEERTQLKLFPPDPLFYCLSLCRIHPKETWNFERFIHFSICEFDDSGTDVFFWFFFLFLFLIMDSFPLYQKFLDQ